VAGNVFTGMADWRSCQSWGEHPLSLKITSVVTSKLYTSRLGVNAHVVGDVPHENVGIIPYLLILVALCNRADHYIVILFLSFFLSFPRLISAVGDWMFTILRHMVWP